jgi:hypothetical protein
MPLSKSDFENFLLEAVDESLSSLGESSKQAIYYHLEKSFNVKKQEIPLKVEAFIAALERIFGLGADFIESLIMARLDEKVEMSPKWHVSRELKLTEYVAVAKQSFIGKKSVTVEVKMDQCEQIETES